MIFCYDNMIENVYILFSLYKNIFLINEKIINKLTISTYRVAISILL